MDFEIKKTYNILQKKIKKVSFNLQKTISLKRILLNSFFILLVIFYTDFINNFIYNNLTPNDFSNNTLVITSFLLLLLIIFSSVCYKFFKKKYIPSLNEINTLFIGLFLIIYFNYFNFNHKWNITETEFIGYKINYVDIIIFFLGLVLITNIIRHFINTHRQFNDKENILLNDNPIEKKKDDILDYEQIVEELTRILRNDNHEKAFTIGIVGPWGNGKSSVFKMVQNNLEKLESKEKKDIISFNFLPYLNHNENDIINEFFTSLSNEIKPYSGKLSNLVIEYSSKITDLYDNKNITGFIENHVTDFKSSSANELYTLINEMLVDINKKIIVFVDDLDRLNKNEILQIFKLIRNTADFRNVFFVVAMDKEYVLKSLKNSKKIFHSSFIDKFFQLEIYLPEIDKSKLKELFIKELRKSEINDGSPLFSIRIKEAVEHKNNLFEDYIKNIRDVKRTVNQIIYDYPNTQGEVNLKDFINFNPLGEIK